MGYYSPIKLPERPPLPRSLHAVVSTVRRRAPWLIDSLGPVSRALNHCVRWMTGRDRQRETAIRAAQDARNCAFLAATGLAIDPATHPLFGPRGLVASVLRTRPLRPGHGVLHCIGSLGPGGAERQLCLLMAGARRAGIETTLLALRPLQGSDAHYESLARASVDRVIDAEEAEKIADESSEDPVAALLIDRLPQAYHADIVHSAAICRQLRPQVVHAWLDSNNVACGLGAILAGVPRIILGLRNVSPRHFPPLLLPEMRELYQVLAQDPRTRLVANTREGARDYAAWIELPTERVAVIPNAVDLDALDAEPRDRAETRRALGIPLDAPLLLGVFRLSEEKCPLMWIDTAERILRALPSAHAIHVGTGAMESEFLARLEQSPERERLHHLGRRDDVHTIMSAAEVILLTSRAEGMPNVLLEAQALGCVAVATAVGGTPEVIESGVTGELCSVGDVAGLASAATALLSNAARRDRMAVAGRARIQERGTVEALVRATRAQWEL